MRVRLLIGLVMALGSACTDEVPRCIGCGGSVPIVSGQIRGDFAGVRGVDAYASEGWVELRYGTARIEVWANGREGERVGHVLELWYPGDVLVPGLSDELEATDGRAPFLVGSQLDATFMATSTTNVGGRYTEEAEYASSLSITTTEDALPPAVRVEWVARFEGDRVATGMATVDTTYY